MILADVHLGKATHFRKNGIGIPAGVENENYAQLSTLLLNYDISRVFILGDLFHSDYNDQWNSFLFFIKKFAEIRFDLIKGNHDILEDNKYVGDNLHIYNKSLEINGFLFSHEPRLVKNKYNIAGHIHPGIKIKGLGKQVLRLPCFFFGKHNAILPAFGAFTGLHILDVRQEDNVYGIAENEVIRLA